MKNIEKYHFSDFTRKNYRRLVQIAKERYRFCSFTDFKMCERFVLWRHDIDFSVFSSLKLAQIEAEEGISSTYFVLLHSNFYNLLEYEITKCINEILELGHYIGLHFDNSFYNLKDKKLLNKYLFREKKIIEEIFNINVSVFSFHNTTQLALSCTDLQYGGMINANAEYLRKEIGYCSDSNGYWRFRRLEDVLNDVKDERLQVLTHPVWWQEKVMSPKERVWKCIEGNTKKMKEWYIDCLRSFNRDNIDWD